MTNPMIPKRRTYFSRLLSGVAALALMGIYFFKKDKAELPRKMLTEDGRLVEVDTRAVRKKGRKITSQEIHHWIKK